jgi:DNA-directed RNA polymerase specialized sigma24 family protein
MTSFHEDLAPLVERAASATAAKWPSYVSTEDVAQEIWLWVYSNQNSIENARRAGDWEGKVYSTMTKVASSTASTEDQQTNGYSSDDTYVYSVTVIESLLESAFSYGDWQSFGTFGDGQPSAKGQVNETGDVMAMLSDIKAGLAEIKPEYREVLFFRHALSLSYPAIGERIGKTESAAGKRHKRAVNALRDALGRVPLSDLQSGWSERREGVGNESARVVTERQYEG